MKKVTYGLLVAMAVIVAITALHDTLYPYEDSRIVWVCGYHGNGVCGPDAAGVNITWRHLLEW